MQRWTARRARLLLGGLALTWVGCGGSDVPDPGADAQAALDSPAPPPEFAPPAAPGAPGNQAPAEFAPPPAQAPAPAAVAEAAPEPAPAASASAPNADAGAAAELLQAANAGAPAVASAPAEGAGAAPGQPAGYGPPPGYGGAPPGYGGSSAGLALADGGGDPAAGANPSGSAPPPGYGGPPPGYGGRPPGGPGGPGGAGSELGGGEGYPGGYAGGPGGGYPGGPGGAGDNAEPNYQTPRDAVSTFLAALRSKDRDRVGEAIALRAATEATPKYQKLFVNLKEGSASDEDIEDLAEAFEGYQVVASEPIQTGRIRVTVGKSENNNQTTRAIEVRREKDGWKVVDFKGGTETRSSGTRRRR